LNYFIFKKTETELKSGQTDRFWFGFFRAKTGSNRLGSVFPVLARFFSGFFRFGFFGFLLIKPKPNQTGWFFQNFNRFNRFFSVIFFGLIGFSIFFHP
jgi:hypothetical protein